MKLYEVTIETKLFVLADSANEAEQEARENMREEEPDGVSVYEVKTPNWPVGHWRDSYPWGGDCDKTVGQILDEMKRPSTPPPIDTEAGGGG